jgi:primosomal protein DnaI
MKKVTSEMIKWELTDELDNSLKQEYAKALKDENFKNLVKHLNVSDDILMKYTSKLQECAFEHGNCQNCQGLATCRNSLDGFILKLEIDGQVIKFGYVPCEYKKKLLNHNRHQKNAYYFDVPKEIKSARMKDIYVSDKNRIEVIKWVKDFITNYETNTEQKGLYLYGNFGSGKTFLIAALFNELAKRGIKIAIIYWPEFLRDLKASFSNDFGSKYNYIKKIPLLLIDDIGAENTTPWERDEILGPLLQYRMQEKLPTFFTSNLSLKELEEHFSHSNYQTEHIKGRRIIERIKQISIEMQMISKNKRK